MRAISTALETVKRERVMALACCTALGRGACRGFALFNGDFDCIRALSSPAMLLASFRPGMPFLGGRLARVGRCFSGVLMIKRVMGSCNRTPNAPAQGIAEPLPQTRSAFPRYIRRFSRCLWRKAFAQAWITGKRAKSTIVKRSRTIGALSMSTGALQSVLRIKGEFPVASKGRRSLPRKPRASSQGSPLGGCPDIMEPFPRELPHATSLPALPSATQGLAGAAQRLLARRYGSISAKVGYGRLEGRRWPPMDSCDRLRSV